MLKKKSYLLLLAAFIVTTAHTQASIQALKTDARAKLVSFNPNEIYPLETHYLISTDVIFGEDEIINTSDIHLGDASSWDIQANRNHLYIKAKKMDAGGNLSVTTNKYDYHFMLHVSDVSFSSSEQTLFLRFVYPTHGNDEKKLALALASVSKNICSNRRQYNLQYSFTGDSEQAPVRACDDGLFTYFKFRTHIELPAIFMVLPDRREEAVNYRMEGAYVVVERIAKAFTLRNGGVVTSVYNDKYIGGLGQSTSAEEKIMNAEKKEPQQPSALPLQGEKTNPFKMLPSIVCIFGVMIILLLCRNGNRPPEKNREIDHYDLHSMSPLSKKPGTVTLAASNEALLREKMAAVKAKDFIERLQAVQNTGVEGSSNSAFSSSSAAPESLLLKSPAADVPIANDANTAFLWQASNSKAAREYATHFGPLPYVIGQGKFIFATLSVAVHSDLPGQITATVSQDIYGEQGRMVLIPRGSRLIGEYRSGLANNQSRLFVVWTRVIEPNGIDVRLGSTGTDALGQAGLTGQVNYHFLERFGTSLLLSIIGAGASTAGVSPSNEYNSAAAYRQSMTQALADQSKSLLNQGLAIPPTIHIGQGEKIMVFVNRDLDFSRVLR